MAVETYEKIDIACQQLNTAIDLFFQGANHFSVITLAGAAKEEMIDMLVRATDNYYGLELPESDQVQRYNEWYMANVVRVQQITRV
jgi:hypothetical protein